MFCRKVLISSTFNEIIVYRKRMWPQHKQQFIRMTQQMLPHKPFRVESVQTHKQQQPKLFYFPHICVGSLQDLWLPPTVQIPLDMWMWEKPGSRLVQGPDLSRVDPVLRPTSAGMGSTRQWMDGRFNLVLSNAHRVRPPHSKHPTVCWRHCQ